MRIPNMLALALLAVGCRSKPTPDVAPPRESAPRPSSSIAPPKPPEGPTELRIGKVGGRDVSVRFDRANCKLERPAPFPFEVIVGLEPPQRFALSTESHHNPIVCDETPYFETGDFNFDGNEDFAVSIAIARGLDRAEFAVFLFVPREGRYLQDAELSQLTLDYPGMFTLDAKKKHVVTSFGVFGVLSATSKFAVATTPSGAARLTLTQTETYLYSENGDCTLQLETVKANGKKVSTSSKCPP